MSGADDPAVLEWAANTGRILVTQDVETMSAWASERISAGEAMPGLVEVSQAIAIGNAVEDLALLAQAGSPEDCAGRIIYLPL